MGSSPEFLQPRLPRAGTVAPNAAITLEGLVLGDRSIELVASVGDQRIDVTVETMRELSHERFTHKTTFCLVRPVRGEWPPGATVTIKPTTPPELPFDVPIGTARDHQAPSFTSLVAPAPRTVKTPYGPTDALAIAHGPFEDAASMFVIVTLELTNGTRHGVVKEGHAGALLFESTDELGHIHAITLADTAGNTHRIVAPCGPLPAAPKVADVAPQPPPAPPRAVGEVTTAFTREAGDLQPVDNVRGAFIATSDSGTANGFSRGHYLTLHPVEGDIEISVSASRITDEHGMPIEIAFRGGFFAVTGTSSWFLYEHDGNWSGWKPTPSTVGPGLVTLRVVQRGQTVTGYVNGELAGSLDLQRAPASAPVGVHFKAQPGAPGKIEFHQFIVRALDVN